MRFKKGDVFEKRYSEIRYVGIVTDILDGGMFRAAVLGIGLGTGTIYNLNFDNIYHDDDPDLRKLSPAVYLPQEPPAAVSDGSPARLEDAGPFADSPDLTDADYQEHVAITESRGAPAR